MAGLEDLLVLDPTSPSHVAWRVDGYRNRWKAGDPAVSWRCPNTGYFRGSVAGRKYQAHRVVFYLVHGHMPDMVDHIDGNKANNAPGNLRAVSQQENQHNRRARGYSYCKQTGKWRATIKCKGIGDHIHLGRFNTEAEARAAYIAAKRKLHPSAPDRVLGGVS